ncbi:MAG: hypothetical protein A4E64_01300 [Syntrophorhabdus sp. PtaU1.Bin058]|nr:MAG: hypothetical protein A4E64_01300 [Syntrophorhabdus sp. PtaU1.Bin058]
MYEALIPFNKYGAIENFFAYRYPIKNITKFMK